MININRQSVRFLLAIIISSVLAYFLFLFPYEKHLATSQKAGQMMKDVEEVEQVITMEEDGRLGNLLTEMATLLLIGREANVSVSLLPQVADIIIIKCFTHAFMIYEGGNV